MNSPLQIIKSLPDKFFCFYVNPRNKKVAILDRESGGPGIQLDWSVYGELVISHINTEHTPYEGLTLHRKKL